MRPAPKKYYSAKATEFSVETQLFFSRCFLLKIKAVLFDLDGTLIDSIPFHKRSFQLLFKKFGKSLPEKAIRNYIRWSTEEIFHRLKVEEKLGMNLESFLEVRREIYYDLIRGKKIVLKDRIAFLKKIRKKYKIALVSNSSHFTVNYSFPKSALKLFDAVVSFSDVAKGKPAPDMLLLAAKRLQVKPSECLMVGDSVVDVLASKAAGMWPVCVSSKFSASSKKDLQKLKPLLVVPDFKELSFFLRQLENA